MDYIIEFYKGLDSINLLLFWGVIVVITLLLIFSIIMINKNNELKKQIAEKAKKTTQSDEIPIKVVETNEVKQTVKNNVTEEHPIAIINETIDEAPIQVTEKYEVKQETITKPQETIIEKPIETTISKKTEPEPHKEFVAEEYIMNYNKRQSNVTTDNSINKLSSINESSLPFTPTEAKPEMSIPNQPYQRNVLREMSLNQTSPIGISKKNVTQELEHVRAEKLNQSLNTNNASFERPNSLNEKDARNESNQQYLNEVSHKLNNAINDVERTAYEIKQEEDAIISYNELIKKRDSIKTIEEEEAIISIEELYRKEKNKLYGITEEEEDNKFIDELKNFRDDL